MRVPIAFGLSWPERIESGASAVDFASLAALSFGAPDPARYPGLPLAWQALRAAPGSTAVLNAANEEAVAAFLAGTIRFDAIHSVNAAVIEAVAPAADATSSLAALLDLDTQARARARAVVKGLS
jgi:1-deoxy-D-xylulose-5-phosphate reductoisomerase